MQKLVLLRHGESTWNRENRFTGWTDVPLSEKGREEARSAGLRLKAEGYSFDLAFTSVLKRAIQTLWICLEEMDLMWIPIINDWRLNERHYGALQGLNKAETAKKYGEDQVFTWRRSYATPPPPLDEEDPRYPANEPPYSQLPPKLIPRAESLRDTVKRFLPFWHEVAVPTLRQGRRILIAAHGNSLRALVKHLDGISDEEIPGLNIPTGLPLIYELDDDLHPLMHYYLADPGEVEAAQSRVANQGKAR